MILLIAYLLFVNCLYESCWDYLQDIILADMLLCIVCKMIDVVYKVIDVLQRYWSCWYVVMHCLHVVEIVYKMFDVVCVVCKMNDVVEIVCNVIYHLQRSCLNVC